MYRKAKVSSGGVCAAAVEVERCVVRSCRCELVKFGKGGLLCGRGVVAATVWCRQPLICSEWCK